MERNRATQDQPVEPEQLSQPEPYQAPEVIVAIPQAIAAQASAQMLAALLVWRLCVYLIDDPLPVSDLNPLLSLFFLAAKAAIVLGLARACATHFASVLSLAQTPNLGLLLAGTGCAGAATLRALCRALDKLGLIWAIYE